MIFLLPLFLSACLPELNAPADTGTVADTAPPVDSADTSGDTGGGDTVDTALHDSADTADTAGGDTAPEVPGDDDGDGFGGPDGDGSDCDDSNAAIYPGAPALCDGLDSDCDSEIDGEGRASFETASGAWSDLSDTFRGYGLYDFKEDGTLWFCAGNWPAQITLTAAQAAIRGRDGPAVTVLDGGQAQVLQISGGSVEVNGLNIANGTAEAYGGCVNIDGGALTTTGVGFYDCKAAVGGGALYIDGGAEVTLLSARLEDNSAGRGGAVYLVDGALHIEDSVVVDNTADADAGGGLTLDAGSVQSVATDWTDNSTIDVYLTLSNLRYDYGDDATFLCDIDGCY